MEKDGKSSKSRESEFVLQWGNKKRLRCQKVKVKKERTFDDNNMPKSRKLKDSPSPLLQRINKSSAPPMNSRKLFITSPEKEDRYYTTRGSLGLDDNGKMLGLDHHGHAVEDKGSNVWPKLFLSLSSKEKEEDFMAMKGCKLPQRPKKRGKLLQKSLHLVMPGVWLSDLCRERYEVREKKTSKKRARGLKAMGSLDSDSD
ncbi:uncharacterized protein LOC126787915 isoform X2 [Argentina anserina]|uniref:uncharacterized protein LOC126787915 isoform X2 n=1 Tax=Argentina anserina TaxID=57926 RepID=UPI0021766982|nr:uncharacterized protein LOC126787915 isoform X2 [Potentilla anserina]